jgi:2-polyprenyl-3-methyl-5-hydroxy-6-metoxy-1,4-benzoquinol methylase
MKYNNLMDFSLVINQDTSTQHAEWDSFWKNSLQQKALNLARKCSAHIFMSGVLMPYINVGSFCELGCGTSILLAKVAKYAKKVYALDYSEVSLQHSKNNFEANNIANYELKLFDIREQSVPGEKKYDVVFSNGLIEHFKEPYRAIQKHMDLLNKGGTAIIVVPAKYSLKHLWYKLTDNKALKKMWLWSEQRFFSCTSLEKELENLTNKNAYTYKVINHFTTLDIVLFIHKE